MNERRSKMLDELEKLNVILGSIETLLNVHYESSDSDMVIDEFYDKVVKLKRNINSRDIREKLVRINRELEVEVDGLCNDR